MARRRWLAPLLVLCGVVGADDASAEIGFDFVMATVVGATLVQALDFVSSQSTQLAYASRNGLLFNGTRRIAACGAQRLAIYAGFDADHAYYAYAYLREDFYKSSGARAAHAGNLTVTLGKNVKGKGLDAEKYVSRGRCDDFDYDLCAVAFTSDALGEPVDALKTTKFDCTTTHWFRSSVKYKTPRRVSEIIAATARTWWRDDLGAYDPKGLFFSSPTPTCASSASSRRARVAPADDLFHYAPNSSNALVANGTAAYVAGVVAGDLRVVNGTFTYVISLDFAIGGLEWYLVTAYDADCPAGYEVRGLGCDPCEDARDSLAGSPVCDRCLPGFYLRGSSCASCPDNGVCLGGLDAPYPREGYWGDAASPHEFYECEPGHCRKKFRCRPGYTGALLALESTTRNRWLLTGSSILAVVLGWLYVNNVLLNIYAPLGMLVYSVQHMAIIARYQIDFPVEFIQKYSLFLDFMLFDVDVFKPSCVITWTPWRSHVTQMLVCALGLLRFVPVTTRVAHKFATDRAYRSFGAVFASLRYEGEFARRSRGRHGDPQVRCDGDNPQRVLYLAFSLLYFFGVVLGLPTYIYYRVQMAYLHDNGVHSPEMLDTLGWAYERFRAPLHDWQFKLTMRTVLICAIATCVDNGSVQVVLTLCLLSLARSRSLRRSLHARPYVKKRHDRFDVFTIDMVFAFVVTTLFIYAHSLGGTVWVVGVVFCQLVFFAIAVFLSVVAWGEDTLRERAIDTLLQLSAGGRRRGHSAARASGARFNLERQTSVARGGRRRSVGAVKHRANVDDTGAGAHFCLEAVHEHYLELSLRMQEMGQTFKQLPFHVWATDARRDAGDYERFAAVAADLKPYVANDSPTSSYSADSRAVFWRKLAQEFPGMIDFCMTELSQVERTVYFGALLRMERYMQRPVRAQALHYLVEDQDRSSVLYYILAAEEHRVVDLRFCMQSILRSCRHSKRRVVAGKHAMLVPRPVAHAALGISVARSSFRKQSSSAALRQRAAEDGEENVYAHCRASDRVAELRGVLRDLEKQAGGASASLFGGGGEGDDAPAAGGFFGNPFADLLFCQAGLDYGRDDAAAREQSCFGPGDVAPPPPAPRPPEPGSPKRKESKKHHKKKHQK
ncbi:hypothetical protein JL721_2714 [Aureococcus anophagefferens]|nr:hypothetical protein JL721_2714 [Aureococcus anophagefferens]